MNSANPPPDKACDANAQGRLANEQASARLAAALAGAFRPGLRLYLSGDLGAGKTSIVRSMLRALGYPGRVRSPSFTLLEPYNLLKFDLYHFDFYRFSSDEEWQEAGFDEYFGGAGVVLVEWPEMGGKLLPEPDLAIRLDPDPDDDDARRIHIRAYSVAGAACLSAARAAGFFGPD